MNKNIFLFSTLLLICFSSKLIAQNSKNSTMDTNEVYPKGQKIVSENFTGIVWVNMLSTDEATYDAHVGNVTFEPGARTNWHYHPGGQILLVTEGVGYYQEKGKPKQIIKKGDVINCPPNISHWHGASAYEGMTHIAIGTNTNKGNVVWQQKVTDEEYKNVTLLAKKDQIVEQEILLLSKQKWQWMAVKNIEALDKLFNEKAVFVHMGGTMTKAHELDIIKTGVIEYKKADIQESSIQIIDNTAILLNKIKLTAIVGGNEVINPFVVTEVYIKENGNWTLSSMSFTKLLTP
jgi:4-carboxymuconolactone decarboxylase